MPAASQSSKIFLPASLQAILDALNQVDADARDITCELTDEQVNWQPDEGRAWSISQCLDHIGKTNMVYLQAMRPALPPQSRESSQGCPMPDDPDGFRPIYPGWFARLFLWSLEPPPRVKMPAPAKIVPASQMARDEVLTAFLDSQWKIRALLSVCANFDLNRVRFQNPFLPAVRFTLGTGFLVLVAHTRRHLWQACQVRESLLKSGA
jgi:hypothetical protein